MNNDIYNSVDFDKVRDLCCVEAFRLYLILKRNPELKRKIRFDVFKEAYCFRCHFIKPMMINHIKISGISISLSPDRNFIGIPSNIEMALINSNGELCYVDSIGYSDVCGFNTSEDVIYEIMRLSSLM